MRNLLLLAALAMLAGCFEASEAEMAQCKLDAFKHSKDGSEQVKFTRLCMEARGYAMTDHVNIFCAFTGEGGSIDWEHGICYQWASWVHLKEYFGKPAITAK